MWYKRFYENEKDFPAKGKVNLLYGPRRVGKTSLIRLLLSKTNQDSNKIYSGEGDDIQLRKVLSSNDKGMLLSYFSDYEYIFIDEAQRIKDVGWGLKILIDNLPETTIIATGSSSFRLSSEVGAPLTGRSFTKMLYPLSVMEMKAQFGGMQTLHELEKYLLYGMYPEVLNAKGMNSKKEYLTELRNSYLLKDILELENVRNSDVMFDLLKLLAFQIGNEVSLSELGNSLGLSKQTVGKYLDLLEKTFIIKKIGGFSRNLRKEVTKSNRYYFFDNGIRNSIINNFNVLSERNDVGMLWENFMVMERLKKQHYQRMFCNNYFWRTYDKKEVDFVEECDGKLYGYEFKWNPRKIKIQKEWLETYPNSTFEVIHRDNFLEFIG